MHTAIGLEVHAQLNTRTKLFCGCSAAYFQQPPNTHTCPVCLGMPGALPVLNRRAVELTLRVGLALGCAVPPRCKFDRKNYFYPDLPKGYQISQYDEPLCADGALEFEHEGKPRRVRVRRVHLEEDAGKLLHGSSGTLVDLNRTGVPLIEIVTEPDLREPAEAAAFMRALRQLLRYLDVCDGDMEKGSLRCDANVSLSPNPDRLGTKTEVKNMNSFKAVEDALGYELARHRRLLGGGERVVQETLGWDADRGEATVMRGKEEAEDYRYFPEPDLPPVAVEAGWLELIQTAMPETPAQRRQRFSKTYGLPAYDVGVLTEEREVADYFEAVLADFNEPKEVSNWVMGEVLRLLKEHETLKLSAADLAQLLTMVKAGEVNRNTAKEVVELAFETGQSPAHIVEERGLRQISDSGELASIVAEVVAAHPEEAADFRNGNEKVLGWFVGQVMARTQGKADPKAAREMLQRQLA